MATPFSCLKSHPLGEDRAAFDELVKEAILTNGATTAEQKLAANIEVAELMLADISKERADVMAQIDAVNGVVTNYLNVESYHSSPNFKTGAPINSLVDNGVYPSDIYSNNAEQYYGSGSKYDKDAFKIIGLLKDRPNDSIKIFRAVPKNIDSINNGDWVSIVKDYAKDHGDLALDGDYRIIEKTVKASEIFTSGDSIQEWGYSPKESKLSSERKEVIDTPEFKKWFGGSKVVDESGDPLIMYHATLSDFNQFKEDRLIFVTPYKKWAENFISGNVGDANKGETNIGANIMPVYVLSKNPFDYRNLKHVNQLATNAMLSKNAISEIKKGLWTRLEERTNLSIIKKLGFDGLYVNESGVNNLAVFESTQIKSATGNQGTFDPANPDIRKSSERNLLITHNLTEQNLIHANKMGGIAVPSLAITKSDSSMKEFGEITLIGSKDIADPKGYAKTNVFGADIYSPRYPSIVYEISAKDKKSASEKIAKYEKQTGSSLDWKEVENYGISTMQDSPVVIAMYLDSIGVKPEIVMEKGVPKEKVDSFIKAGLDKYFNAKSRYELASNPNFIKEAADYQIKYYEDRAKEIPPYQEFADELKSDKFAQENVARKIAEDILLISKEKSGGSLIDVRDTRDAVRKQVEGDDNFKSYVDDFMSSMNAKEKIFKGYSNDGNRKYQPHTIENVVKELKKNLRGGEGFNYGAGSVRAQFTPQFKSIADIKKNDYRLTDAATFEKVKEEINTELFELGNLMGIDRTETVISIIEDAPKMGFANAAKQYNKDIGDVAIEAGNQFIEKLRSLPTEYFEAKILRSVDLSEFSGAVVPKNISDRARSILVKNGIPIKEYEGDSNRQKVVEAFSKEIDSEVRNILFSTARNAIPLYEENKSITETLQTVAKNPKLASEVAKNLLSTGSAQNKTVETLVTNLFDSDNTLEQIARRTGKSKEAKAFLDTQKSYKAAGEKVIADTLEEYYEPMQATLQDAWRNTFSDMAWYKETGYKQFLNDLSTVGNLVMHGKERNADIARKTQGKDLAGSGRTNVEIDQIEKDINKEAAGLIDLYKKIYVENLKPMIDIANNAKKTSGLITPEMEAGRQDYQWYVPLYGDPSEFNTMAVGGADKLSSNKDKGAMGREGTLADNVLQNVLVQMSTSVKKASMQNMKRDFVAWVKSSKDVREEMGAKVNSPESTEIFEKYKGADGLVHERVKNSALSPNVFVYKNGAETTTIEIKNQEVITSLNGLSPVEGLLGGVQKATRLMSAVFTRYNPIFPVMNKLRDSQSQISFILADAPVENVTEVARKTLANNLKYTRQWNKKSADFQKWMDKYESLGGQSTYSDLLNDKVMKNLEQEFAVAVDSKFTIQKYANKVSKLVDAVNDHMEMSSRVAMFQSLVETGGMSEKDAMLYTKNTMNFETKGKWGQQLSAIYAFASPALFDARRMGQALRTPRGAMVMGAHFALMYGLYGALKSLGGDDEDGVARLNKVSVNQSGRWLTFISEDGTGYKIPVGFGFGRIALTLAASVHRYMDGVDDVGEFSQHVAIDGLLSNFSVIEPKNISIKDDAMGWALQTFLPTVAQPMYQVAANQNFQGAPIHKPDEWTGSKLRFTQSWPNTPQLYKDAAALMYETTGLDVYPETMAHLLRSYGGNGVVDVTRAFMLAGEKSEKEWTLADIPAIQGFASRQSSQDSNRFRTNFENSLKLEDQRKYAMKNGTLEVFDAEHPDFRKTMSIYKSANKVIKDLYTRRKAVQGTDEAKEINKQIRAIQARANQEAEI